MNKHTVWLHDDQFARIIALVGKQGFSDFMRRAAGEMLDWEEAHAAKRGNPDVDPAPSKPASLGSIDSLFEDD